MDDGPVFVRIPKPNIKFLVFERPEFERHLMGGPISPFSPSLYSRVSGNHNRSGIKEVSPVYLRTIPIFSPRNGADLTYGSGLHPWNETR